MLHALLLILAPLQVAPAPNPDNPPQSQPPQVVGEIERALLEVVWKKQAAAPGLRLELELRFESPGSNSEPETQRILVSGTLAKPAAGKLILILPEDEEGIFPKMELVGTGEQVHLVSHEERTAMLLGERWRETPVEAADLLGAWAGIPAPAAHDVELLPAVGKREDWLGFQYRVGEDESLYTLWVDAAGHWRESTVTSEDGSRMVVSVSTWELLAEVDEQALRQALPLDYATGVEWLPEDRVGGAEQEPQVNPMPQVDVFPGGDAEAVAYLKVALARYARADALHFRLSGTAQDGESFGTVIIEGRIAKPTAGRLDISTRTLTTDANGVEQEQLDSLSMLGNGEGIRRVDHSRRLLIDAPVESWAESIFITDLPAFQTWAGAPQMVMHDLTFAQEDSENYPGHVGLQWLDESDGLITMWFDTGGAWVATHVMRDFGPDMQAVFWVAVESMELLSDVDSASYNAESPAGYGVDYDDGLTVIAAPPPPALVLALDAFDYDPELFPLADADALVYLLAFRDRCAAAPALHFDAEAVMDSPDSHAEIGLNVRAMLPSSGTIESRAKMYRVEEGALHLEMELNFSYVGDGKNIHGFELDKMSFTEAPTSGWAKSSVVGGLFLFSAWSGSPQKTLHGLAFAAPEENRTGQTGVTWQTDNRQQQTWWFDAEGSWVACTMVDGVDENASVVRMTVSNFELITDPDPKTYRSELPAGLR